MREVAGEEDKESEKDLILYFMNRFSWDHYGPELGDFGNAFGGHTVYVTRFCMAAALYLEVAWARGEKWIFPVIPDKLTKTHMRREGKRPERPTCSKGRHADELKFRCREWWMYFLALLQCWKDETCAFDFGGALRPDCKVMMFVYWRVKEVFKRAGVTDFHLYQVRNRTDWAAVRQQKFTDDEITAEWGKHQKAHTEMADCKEWMNRRYEAEAILEYSDLLKSGGDFDALVERRVDPVRRPGDENQFHKERQAEERRNEERRKGAPGAPQSTVDAERQLQRQKQSEERQSYSRQRAEEIRAREGTTPSPITYDAGSPAASMPPAPVKQKKKISWAEHQTRVSKEPSQPSQGDELADLDEKIQRQQAEVDYYQREVDRLKREQEELAREQEKMRYEQDRLEQKRLRDLELIRQHELEAKRQHELSRRQRHEKRRLEKEEQRRLELEEKYRAEQERLAATTQDQFGSHTPLQDENGEPLDYYDNVDRTEETWQRLQASAPINIALEKSRQEALAREAALLKGPTQPTTAAEEEVLLANQAPEGWDAILQQIESLPAGALSQLSQHIDVVQRRTPSSASPRSPGPPPGLPESTPLNTDIANRILKATSDLGQLPSRPVTEPPGERETRRATDLLVEQMRAPGTPRPAARQ